MSDSSEPSTTAASTVSSSSGTKKTGGARLPSLNQLAARISSNQAAANGGTAPPLQPTTSAPRPRLPAFALRTGSTTSLNTTTSNTDSMAVNPSSTRSASPATSNASQQSNATTGGGPGGDPLTVEGLDKLNQENGTLEGVAKVAATVIPEVPKKKVGYKNIPSLDAITARLAKQRASQLSIDGSTMPPEPEMIEDPKTPGVPMKAPEHPLQFPWTIYHDTKAKFPFTPATAATGQGFNQPPPGMTSAALAAAAGEPPYSASHPPESTEYEAGLTVIGEFDTVEEFCRYFNWLKPPSKLEKNSNYHIFKSGIKPMWEDPANAEGGKWVLTMKNNPVLLDRCWGWLAMALVGEELEENDEICGAVVSLRSKVDRIQVWTRSKDDVEKLNGIGKRLIKLLDVSEADNIGLDFQYNSDDRPPPNKFLSIQSAPASSYRSSFQAPPGGTAAPSAVASGPGAAFGGFGTGMGIGGQVWKAAAKRA
ncbi:translation initiation factor eIF4e [Pholiota conissans]|uniref:Translation initiation factor eIF4e n=1 Tax=Pholiota conissans TaxID=109636 RepID=A0A9P5ZHW8_9AGAR|nr:translation initiation factor eIF4e [Pholiota conissans]